MMHKRYIKKKKRELKFSSTEKKKINIKKKRSSTAWRPRVHEAGDLPEPNSLASL